MPPAIEPGKTYTVAGYPFSRSEFQEYDGEGVSTRHCWRPGCETDIDDRGRSDLVAEGVGAALLTVVDVHRPGKFPARVFFTRQWRDPEGNVFGKGALHITTKANFTRLLRGYRHTFYIDGEEVRPA